jgi:quercetin dioxygenase-like cupin family protein
MRNFLLILPILIPLSCGPEAVPAPAAPPPTPVQPGPPAPVSSAPAAPVASAAPTATVAAAPAPSPTDPLVVGPNIYKSVFENDHVRVLDVGFKPGDSIKMHSHPDHLVYVVSGGKLKITPGEGAAKDFDLKAGQALFLAAQSHAAENVGKTPIKLVVFELKPGATAAPAPQGKDPIKAGPGIYKPVFENEHVRVMKVTFDKSAKIAMHTHPDHVVYVLMPGKLRITAGKNPAQDFDLKEGQAMFLGAQEHSAENAGSTKIEVLVVELKSGAAKGK